MPNIGISQESYDKMETRKKEFKTATNGGELSYAAIVEQALKALEKEEKDKI